MIDERTKNYFEAIKENAGYVGKNAGWYDIKEILEKKNILESANLELVKSYPGYANSSDIRIYAYQTDKGKRYCAELDYRTDIDDYCIETHIFTSFPSRNTVITIRDVNNLEFDFKHRRLQPEFTCWECNRMTHWLDVEGGFESKKTHLEERYCGC